MRRRWVFAGAALLLLLGGAVSWLTLHPSRPADRTVPPEAETARAETARLEAALNSTTPRGQAAALALELRELAAAQRVRLLPPGARVVLLPTTFAHTSATTATVEATVDDGHRFRLLLVREDRQWLLVATEALS